MTTKILKKENLNSNIPISMLKGALLNLGIQKLTGNLKEESLLETLLIDAAAKAVGDYTENDYLTAVLLSAGNSTINKSNFLLTTLGYTTATTFAKGMINIASGKKLKNQDEILPITDAFLSEARKVWFKDFPMQYIKKFTVENITEQNKIAMINNGSHGLTNATTIDGFFFRQFKSLFSTRCIFKCQPSIYCYGA